MTSTGTLYTETTQFTRGGAMRAHLSGTLFRTPIDGTKMSCHCCCCFHSLHANDSCLHTDVEIFLEQQLTRHAMVVHVGISLRHASQVIHQLRTDRPFVASVEPRHQQRDRPRAFRMPELIFAFCLRHSNFITNIF